MNKRNPDDLLGIVICTCHPTKYHRLIPGSMTKLPPRNYFPQRIAELEREIEYLTLLEKFWDMPTEKLDG
jgi:hypothetical protein